MHCMLEGVDALKLTWGLCGYIGHEYTNIAGVSLPKKQFENWQNTKQIT